MLEGESAGAAAPHWQQVLWEIIWTHLSLAHTHATVRGADLASAGAMVSLDMDQAQMFRCLLKSARVRCLNTFEGTGPLSQTRLLGASPPWVDPSLQ